MELTKTNDIHKAKMLYLSGTSIPEIALLLGIEESTLKTLALGPSLSGRDPSCWHYERSILTDSGQQKWLKTFIENKGQVMESIVGTAAEVIAHGLLSLKKEQSEGRVLSVKELKEISSIIMDMDKIARLESGKATEIIHNTALTPDEARKILMSDPFMRPIEVEVIRKDEHE